MQPTQKARLMTSLFCLSCLPNYTNADTLEHSAASLTMNAASRAQAGSTDIADVVVDAANIAAQKGIDAAKKKAAEDNLHDWMMRTDVQVQFKKDDDPTISIETINPIHQNELNTTFWQGRIASRDGDQTLNLGLGHRRLVSDKQWMLGINAFVDQTREHSHQRLGLGLEAFGPYTTLRYNNYSARSDEKLLNNNAGIKTLERAQSGWDLGLESPYTVCQLGKIGS